jgi:hypothetical protein
MTGSTVSSIQDDERGEVPPPYRGIEVRDDAGVLIAGETVQRLATLNGADIEVTLEIDAHLPDGAPEDVMRTVTENASTLKFTDQGFEEY